MLVARFLGFLLLLCYLSCISGRMHHTQQQNQHGRRVQQTGSPSSTAEPQQAHTSAAAPGAKTTSTETHVSGSATAAASNRTAGSAAVNRTINRAGAPRMPMPAAVPFNGSIPTFHTYNRELGASINGTPFIPGACGPKPSALGYQCSWPAPDGVIIHWSHSVTHPPINRCTQNNAVESTESQNMWDGAVAVHFALQAATPAKLHLTFVEPAGRFFPSEGLHGWGHCTTQKCSADTPPEVQVLYYDAPGSYVMTGQRSVTNSSLMEGWAAWASADFDGLTGVLCVSRRAHSKVMKAGANIAYEAQISYAVNNRSSYTAYSRRAGMAVIDFRTGKARKAELPMAAMAAHGALMIVAFAVMLPSGLLVVRHKWLFIDQEHGGSPSPLWVLAHMLLLIIGSACGLAGMIVALVAFGNSETGMLMSTHQVLGIITIALSLVLVVIYGLRPLVRQPHRVRGSSHPLLGPQKTAGLITVLAGWATLFLGCAVVHYSWAVPLSTWVAPCAIFCGLAAAAGIALELRFQKLVRTGVYNPKTFTINSMAPLPLARVRTAREPYDPKKQEFLSSYDAESADGSTPGSTPGSTSSGGGIKGAIGAATAALSYRGHLTSLIKDAQRVMSTSSSGGSSASPRAGGADNLHFRRARQSSNASGISTAGGVATGFPSTPGERAYTSEHC